MPLGGTEASEAAWLDVLRSMDETYNRLVAHQSELALAARDEAVPVTVNFAPRYDRRGRLIGALNVLWLQSGGCTMSILCAESPGLLQTALVGAPVRRGEHTPITVH
ncbi:MAG TPA: hypothetical protein VMI52_15085 [Acetobacteraceae bacterium]|nr:hypothetical protein [Acetobacteraceae bacterium]